MVKCALWCFLLLTCALWYSPLLTCAKALVIKECLPAILLFGQECKHSTALYNQRGAAVSKCSWKLRTGPSYFFKLLSCLFSFFSSAQIHNCIGPSAKSREMRHDLLKRKWIIRERGKLLLWLEAWTLRPNCAGLFYHYAEWIASGWHVFHHRNYRMTSAKWVKLFRFYQLYFFFQDSFYKSFFKLMGVYT